MQTTDPKKKSFADIFAQWEKTPEAKKAEAQIKEKESQPQAPRRSINYEKKSADATIDLHGLTVAEAQAQLNSLFIEAHKKDGKKCLSYTERESTQKRNRSLRKQLWILLSIPLMPESMEFPGLLMEAPELSGLQSKNNYFSRKMILPLVRSYGERAILTLSPGTIRM